MVSRVSFTESPDYMQSLARGLQVLCAFNREQPRCTLSEIAAQTGLSRAVARRSLLTLRHLGYVTARGRHFFLTPRVLELGHSYLSSLDLTELAHEAMEQLSQRVGECRAGRGRAVAGICHLDGSRPVGGQIGQRAQRLVARK
jgi:IclR family pca regulon transcriptional regulator